MSKRSIYWLFIIPAFGFVNAVYADYMDWTNDGGDRLWTNRFNWSGSAAPTQWTWVTIDNAGGSGPIINSVMNVLLYGIDGPGKSLAGQTNMDITGGTFHVTSTNWTLGINSGSVGVANISNATVQIDKGLNVGQNGSGTINMNSGTMTINGNIWIPCGTGAGRINLYGGTIRANACLLYGGGQPRIDIISGTMILTGDQTSNINYYVNYGWITAYNGKGQVIVSYDSSKSQTTVAATGPAMTASSPIPANGAVAAPGITALNWDLPAGLNNDSVVKCDVLFGTDPGLAGASTLVSNQAVESVSLGQSLTVGQTYYWRVDCYDISGPGTIKTTGAIWSFTVSTSQNTSTTLASPDGNVMANIFVSGGRLKYNLKRGTVSVLKDSDMGITINSTDLGNGVVFFGDGTRTQANQTYPWYGLKSQVNVTYNNLLLTVGHLQSGISWTLEARAYNNGFAFRYVVPGDGDRVIGGEATDWVLPTSSNIWYETNTLHAEAYYSKKGVTSIAANTHIGFPVTVELPSSGGYAAITEGALQNYSGMSLIATGTTRLASNFENFPLYSDASGNVPGPATWHQTGTITTAWRIIMTGSSLNDLVNCDIVHSVCPAPDTNLYPQGIMTDWITPGRATWNYIINVTSDYNSLMALVDEASELGFEYTVLDAGWWGMTAPGKDHWACLKDICTYAKSKNIRVMVWAALVDYKNYSTRQSLFRSLQQAGCAGVKFDFVWGEDLATVQLLSTVLQEAVQYKLLINWHGNAKPTGNARTWPNQITCKAVKGLEYFMWETPPLSHYATLPFTRCLAGPADTTPCTFTTSLLQGTTFSFQLASAITSDSPLMHWADWPDLYLVSPSVDMIRTIPSTWDQTVVLSGSQIGNLAALAKRKGNDWFVGIINGTSSRRTYTLNLSFLGSGNYYVLTVSDKQGDASAMTIATSTLNNTQSIIVTLESGGGYSARFTRIKLSPESSWSACSQAVTVQNSYNGADIRYTIDGSEPNASSPAYSGPVILTQSCVLRTKVVSGDGQGSEARGYYKISPPTPALPNVYLSDLSWVSQSVGWGTTAQINKSIQGYSLNVAGTTYQKGIGAHSYSEIVYNLKPEYKYFVAVVGVDEEVTNDLASVVFKIYADGALLAQSPVVRRHQFWNFNVPLPHGSSQIKLVATTADDTNNSDHADWVNAGFITATDIYDFANMASNWLNSGCSGSSTCGGADLDANGKVDVLDFAKLAQQWISGLNI